MKMIRMKRRMRRKKKKIAMDNIDILALEPLQPFQTSCKEYRRKNGEYESEEEWLVEDAWLGLQKEKLLREKKSDRQLTL